MKLYNWRWMMFHPKHVWLNNMNFKNIVWFIKAFLNVILFCEASLDPRARFPWERGSWETYWHFSELIRRVLIYIYLCTLSKLSIQFQNTYDISGFAQITGITSCCLLDVNHENYNFLDCDWLKKNSCFPLIHLPSCYRTVFVGPFIFVC